MEKNINTFIAEHTDILVRVIAVIIAIWFVAGMLLVDYLHPAIFLPIFIPIGLIGAWWAKKW